MAVTDETFSGKCFSCGEHAHAFWMADPTVYVCGSCAIEKLPLLIADAVVASRPIFAERVIEPIVERINGAFWRGLALRLIAHNRQEKSEHKGRRPPVITPWVAPELEPEEEVK